MTTKSNKCYGQKFTEVVAGGLNHESKMEARYTWNIHNVSRKVNSVSRLVVIETSKACNSEVAEIEGVHKSGK